MKAALRPDEERRLAILDDYQILDTPREPSFDAVTALVAAICDAPMAVVNLISEDRQWFKSEVGFGVRETPLDTSICSHAILQHDLFIIPDTTKDARFANNALVTGEPRLRFYAGALLKTPGGIPLGTLCVLDVEPRELDAKQIEALETLAQHVMNMFELKRINREQLKQNEELARAVSDRKRLLATVAHDLRVPLSVVAMGAESIEDSDYAAQVCRETVPMIRRAGQSMLRLASDLVETAKAEAAPEPHHPFELASFVKGVVDMLRPLAAASSVDLSFAGGGDAQVTGAEDRIYQVLTNLIGNALKFTPAGGTVQVRVESTGDVVRTSVRDSGEGIDASLLANIFDPFVQVSSADSRGAGLGLSIARTIIEAHGGSLGASSTLGEGSIFTFELPRANERTA